jgi:hypothetical protein
LSQDVQVRVAHGFGAEQSWACPAMPGVGVLVGEL